MALLVSLMHIKRAAALHSFPFSVQSDMAPIPQGTETGHASVQQQEAPTNKPPSAFSPSPTDAPAPAAAPSATPFATVKQDAVTATRQHSKRAHIIRLAAYYAPTLTASVATEPYPPYTPSIILHASTVYPDGGSPRPAAHTVGGSGAEIALVVGAVLFCLVAGSGVALVARWYRRDRRKGQRKRAAVVAAATEKPNGNGEGTQDPLEVRDPYVATDIEHSAELSKRVEPSQSNATMAMLAERQDQPLSAPIPAIPFPPQFRVSAFATKGLTRRRAMSLPVTSTSRCSVVEQFGRLPATAPTLESIYEDYANRNSSQDGHQLYDAIAPTEEHLLSSDSGSEDYEGERTLVLEDAEECAREWEQLTKKTNASDAPWVLVDVAMGEECNQAKEQAVWTHIGCKEDASVDAMTQKSCGVVTHWSASSSTEEDLLSHVPKVFVTCASPEIDHPIKCIRFNPYPIELIPGTDTENPVPPSFLVKLPSSSTVSTTDSTISVDLDDFPSPPLLLNPVFPHISLTDEIRHSLLFSDSPPVGTAI